MEASPALLLLLKLPLLMPSVGEAAAEAEEDLRESRVTIRFQGVELADGEDGTGGDE